MLWSRRIVFSIYRIMSKHRKICIDISGPNGNAFVLISFATRFAAQMNIPREQVIREMMSGDYDNLTIVFERHFGSIATVIK